MTRIDHQLSQDFQDFKNAQSPEEVIAVTLRIADRMGGEYHGRVHAVLREVHERMREDLVGDAIGDEIRKGVRGVIDEFRSRN